MVYLTTFYAGLSGSTLQGALVMLGFGLGTMPALIVLGASAGGLAQLTTKVWLRTITAVVLVVLAVATVVGQG